MASHLLLFPPVQAPVISVKGQRWVAPYAFAPQAVTRPAALAPFLNQSAIETGPMSAVDVKAAEAFLDREAS